MATYKIIFTGPVGSGKTTAVASLSDIPPVKTDCMATDMTRQRKAETTVAMDYGRVNLSDGVAVHLYGTPGQERFDFMWEILVGGGIGLVLLIDNTRDDPFQDLRFFVNAFGKFIAETGMVIGIASFGESAPAPALYAHFGITSERVCEAVRTLVHRHTHRQAQALPEHIVPSDN